MLHAQVIRELGGPTFLAERLGYGHSSVVSRWATRGIPPMLWGTIAKLCAQHEPPIRCGKRRPLTWQDFADASPLFARRRAA
jgi:hypothetical protein